MMKRTTATCPTCDTEYAGVPVDGDEDGNYYAALDLKACADPSCENWLCENCPRFHCDGCGKHFCESHLVIVPDGTDRPLQCCAVCAIEASIDGAPDPEPGREALPAIAAGELAGVRCRDLELAPACACVQTASVLFDPRRCEAHNSDSEHNVAIREMATYDRRDRFEGKAA